MLVVLPSDEDSSTDPGTAYWTTKQEQLQNVTDFFNANSGGTQVINFELPTTLMVSSDFTRADCSSSSSCPDGVQVAANLISAYNASASYDRVVLAYRDGCSCLSTASTDVLGSVVQIGASDESELFSEIVARGIAHTNGASRGSPDDDLYNNPFSVMGGDAGLPEGHFTVLGKVAFGWLDPATQVSTFARADHPECGPVDGGSCTESGQVWLEAHDVGGTYDDTKVYALRIYTGLRGTALWVEYRKAYRDINGLTGAIMTWGPENPPLGEAGSDAMLLSRYGPAQTIRYRLGDDDVTDYEIPVGGSFVYDLDGTAVEIRVLARDDDDGASTGRLQIEIAMLDRTFERSYPYPTTEESEEDGGPIREAGVIACEHSRWLYLSNETIAEDSFFLYRLTVPDPREVTFQQYSCRAGSSGVDFATLYVYDAYPIHLMRQANRGETVDVAVGAIGAFDVTCNGAVHNFEIDLLNDYSLEEEPYRPMALDYYVVMYRSSDEDEPLLSRLWFEVTCSTGDIDCRDNFYTNRTGDCLQCTSGLESVLGSNREDDCFESAASVSLEWSVQTTLSGTYVQSEASHGAAPVFVRSSPSVAYLLKSSEEGTWGVLTASSLEADYANPTLVELPVLSSLHRHPMAAGSTLTSSTSSETVTLSAVASSTSSYVDPYGNSFTATYLGWSFHNYVPSESDLTGVPSSALRQIQPVSTVFCTFLLGSIFRLAF